MTAGLLYFGAPVIEQLYAAADVTRMTALFFVFVFLAATQVKCTISVALMYALPNWAESHQKLTVQWVPRTHLVS